MTCLWDTTDPSITFIYALNPPGNKCFIKSQYFPCKYLTLPRTSFTLPPFQTLRSLPTGSLFVLHATLRIHIIMSINIEWQKRRTKDMPKPNNLFEYNIRSEMVRSFRFVIPQYWLSLGYPPLVVASSLFEFVSSEDDNVLANMIFRPHWLIAVLWVGG